MKCLIRSETDGYLPSLATKQKVSCGQEKSATNERDDLAGLLVSTGGNFGGSETIPNSSSTSLQIQTGTGDIPQEAIFDLKTRTINRPYNEEEILPRLWVNQTPNFVLAYHTAGLFEEQNIQIKNMREPVKAWEERNGKALARLVAVIRKICETARNTEDGKLDVMVREHGVLEVRGRAEGDEVGDVLPGDLLEKWVIDTSS